MRHADRQSHQGSASPGVSCAKADKRQSNKIQGDRPGSAPALGSPIQDVDAVRTQKITKISQALADGSYHVSASDLAEKLIEHMLESYYRVGVLD